MDVSSNKLHLEHFNVQDFSALPGIILQSRGKMKNVIMQLLVLLVSVLLAVFLEGIPKIDTGRRGGLYYHQSISYINRVELS